MTVEALKAFLSTPAALFALMLFGSVLSMFKQVRDAHVNGSTVGTAQYLLSIETIITLGGNILAFVALIMTDTLNFMGALGIGYAINSLADLKPGGRSAMIIANIPDGPTE
jgi:hypothetical protein